MEDNEKSKDATVKEQNKILKIINLVTKTVINSIYTILALIVIILIYNIIQVSIFNKPYMNILGYTFFQVKTGSMSGTMEIGDIIIVKLTKDVNKNDIITYEQGKSLITHRIVEQQDGTITTKGDANNSEDEPISQDEVIGKVVYTLRNVEIWKNVFRTPEVYALIVITLVLFGITASIEEKKE